jgi:hypothetical protein
MLFTKDKKTFGVKEGINAFVAFTIYLVIYFLSRLQYNMCLGINDIDSGSRNHQRRRVALVISDNKIINGIVVDVFLILSISIVGNGNASLVVLSPRPSANRIYGSSR